MKHLIKTVSFLALMSVIPGVMAASPRASVIGKAASRLPSFNGYMNPLRVITTATGTTTSSGTLTNSECVEQYVNCIKSEDICGEDFEECSDTVSFHAQMPKCDSVLLRCGSTGISLLFGVGNGNINSLADVASYVAGSEDTEIAEYKYPTKESRLGMWISASADKNKYNTQQCVKKYTTCLKRDSVCGEDFEMCTTNKEFKKQASLCASTYARCKTEGRTELFGWDSDNSIPGSPSKIIADSNIDQMIKNGAALAAGNAVNTCYKVADQCIMKACGANPARCVVGQNKALAEIADVIAQNEESGQAVITTDQLAEWAGAVSKIDVKRYTKNMCLETIGNNAYCFLTYALNNPGDVLEYGDVKLTKISNVADVQKAIEKLPAFEREELYSDVFEDIYESRMNAAMGQRLKDMMAKYDASTRDKCSNTIKSCAMRVCGGGIGSLCWTQVFGTGGTNHINAGDSYDEIDVGCRAVVNSDANCQYAANIDGTNFVYVDGAGEPFDTLFPKAGGVDTIGVVASLDGALATSYDKTSIDNMRRQCEKTAISCVKSMCGKDYENCYRNRNDIYAGNYDTKSQSFNNSMNKTGGVLDYNIVTGLCLETVKNAKSCEEHLRISAAKAKITGISWTPWTGIVVTKEDTGWGDSVRDTWLGNASNAVTGEVLMGCTVDKGDDSGQTDTCKAKTEIRDCGSMDSDGCLYESELYESESAHAYSMAANTVFSQILGDVERTVQATYKAKLQREQNVCLGYNNGGIRDETENNAKTFKWVKMSNGAKVPDNYDKVGLKDDQIIDSNDLYGSFCAMRVVIHSDDEYVNEVLETTEYAKYQHAYFALGDSFRCGSWIPSKAMDKITTKIRDNTKIKNKDAILAWSTVAPALLGGGAGALVGNYLANGKISSGVFGAKDTAGTNTYLGSCVKNAEKCMDGGTNYDSYRSRCRSARSDASGAGLKDKPEYKDFVDAFNEAEEAYDIWKDAETEYKNAEDSDKLNKKDAMDQAKSEMNKAGDKVKRAAYGLQDICQNGGDDSAKKRSDTYTGVGAAIGAVSAGALGFGIAYTAVKAKEDAKKDKAVKEWYEQIGEKIQCYVGGKYLGSYDDVITMTVE